MNLFKESRAALFSFLSGEVSEEVRFTKLYDVNTIQFHKSYPGRKLKA